MDIEKVRAEFPALRARDGVEPAAYLDSACMSLVPQTVLDAQMEYYRDFPGCAGRSLHRYAEEVSRRVEASRSAFAQYLHAATPQSVAFVRNATEAINIVGRGLKWKRGDRVLISDQEHNSNLVLWQRLVQELGIRLEILHLSDDGVFDSAALEAKLSEGVRLVSLFQTSNLDGRSLPVQEIVERAHDRGALVLFDGCQAAPHRPVDLSRVDLDFYALSVHKMLGPTGTGLLAGRPEALAELSPLIYGGETVEWTTLEDHALRPPPHRFEAGLQNYAGIVGAHAGLRFLTALEPQERTAHERSLNTRLTDAFAGERRIRILGPANPSDRPTIFAFSVEGIDPHDVALFLDTGPGVLVRSGRHCVHSWYSARGLSGSVRASFFLYTSTRDVDRMIQGLGELLERVPAPT
ncbi:MAG: aminotransferase class V-fold PLP-dependent enzyme [Thermoplasmata archaeon]|nr:aminotransferase class V-fold PLP-dependent enzyme [Thermoplasmata archaeon]